METLQKGAKIVMITKYLGKLNFLCILVVKNMKKFTRFSKILGEVNHLFLFSKHMLL